MDPNQPVSSFAAWANSEAVTIAQAATMLPPCLRRCAECPERGHHWMLDDDGSHDWSDDDEDNDMVRISCKHCDTSMLASIDDPDLPQI